MRLYLNDIWILIMKNETVQFINNLSGSAASQGIASHSHEHGSGTHEHGLGEHGHTHEHLDNAGTSSESSPDARYLFI